MHYFSKLESNLTHHSQNLVISDTSRLPSWDCEPKLNRHTTKVIKSQSAQDRGKEKNIEKNQHEVLEKDGVTDATSLSVFLPFILNFDEVEFGE